MSDMTDLQKDEMRLENDLYRAFGRYLILGEQLANGRFNNEHIQKCIKAFDDLCLARSALSAFLGRLLKENPR